MSLINNRPFYDYNEIIPRLYVGNINSASDADLMNKLKITHLLTADLVPLSNVPPVANYLHVQLRDSDDEDLLSRLTDTNRFIDSCLNTPDGCCFVHCIAGISRSASIVIAYLMYNRHISFERAFQLVRERRNQIYPNSGFQHQLVLFYEMGFRLDPNHTEFRQLALTQLQIKVQSLLFGMVDQHERERLFKQAFTEYLSRVHESEQLRPTRIVFKCKKCRMFLFNERNLRPPLKDSERKGSEVEVTKETFWTRSYSVDSGKDKYQQLQHQQLDQSHFIRLIEQQSSCGSFYIEPLKWMQEAVFCCSGILNCHHCFTKLGSFKWQGLPCEPTCKQHLNLVPAFKVDRKKVDIHAL